MAMHWCYNFFKCRFHTEATFITTFQCHIFTIFTRDFDMIFLFCSVVCISFQFSRYKLLFTFLVETQRGFFVFDTASAANKYFFISEIFKRNNISNVTNVRVNNNFFFFLLLTVGMCSILVTVIFVFSMMMRHFVIESCANF